MENLLIASHCNFERMIHKHAWKFLFIHLCKFMRKNTIELLKGSAWINFWWKQHFENRKREKTTNYQNLNTTLKHLGFCDWSKPTDGTKSHWIFTFLLYYEMHKTFSKPIARQVLIKSKKIMKMTSKAKPFDINSRGMRVHRFYVWHLEWDVLCAPFS